MSTLNSTIPDPKDVNDCRCDGCIGRFAFLANRPVNTTIVHDLRSPCGTCYREGCGFPHDSYRKAVGQSQPPEWLHGELPPRARYRIR